MRSSTEVIRLSENRNNKASITKTAVDSTVRSESNFAVSISSGVSVGGVHPLSYKRFLSFFLFRFSRKGIKGNLLWIGLQPVKPVSGLKMQFLDGKIIQKYSIRNMIL